MQYGFVALGLPLLLPGCEPATDPHRALHDAFKISYMTPGPDGRPVIDIKPDPKWFRSVASTDKCILMVRRNGVAYYMRWYEAEVAKDGIQMDLDIPIIGAKPGDKLSVGVERINPQDASDYVRLSNVLDLAQAPPANPPSTTSGPKSVQ